MNNERYYFSEDVRGIYPELLNKSFTKEELIKIYTEIVYKEVYPDFECWMIDMRKMGLVTEKAPEVEGVLELLDRIEEVRQRTYDNPAQYPTDYAIRLITAIVASYFGYEDRVTWTEELKSCESSRYHRRYYHTIFHP